jgi:hypothetical protein
MRGLRIQLPTGEVPRGIADGRRIFVDEPSPHRAVYGFLPPGLPEDELDRMAPPDEDWPCALIDRYEHSLVLVRCTLQRGPLQSRTRSL